MIKTYAEGSLFFLSVIIFQCLRILATYSVFSRHEEIILSAYCWIFCCWIGFMQSAKPWTQNTSKRWWASQRKKRLQLSYLGLSSLGHG